MPIVVNTMINRRSVKSQRTGTELRFGNMKRITCGIVSPSSEFGQRNDTRNTTQTRTDDDPESAHPYSDA